MQRGKSVVQKEPRNTGGLKSRVCSLSSTIKYHEETSQRLGGYRKSQLKRNEKIREKKAKRQIEQKMEGEKKESFLSRICPPNFSPNWNEMFTRSIVISTRDPMMMHPETLFFFFFSFDCSVSSIQHSYKGRSYCRIESGMVHRSKIDVLPFPIVGIAGIIILQE